MNAIQNLIDRCESDAMNLGMAELARMTNEAAAELAQKDAALAEAREALKPWAEMNEAKEGETIKEYTWKKYIRNAAEVYRKLAALNGKETEKE